MTVSILVVDDEPDISRLIKLVLEDEGYAVHVARNGQEAVACIGREPPALILLDLNMPVMSGWDLHQRLRACRPEIPVVFMTAGARAKAEAERWSAAGHIAKPFELQELVDVVARCLPPPSV